MPGVIATVTPTLFDSTATTPWAPPPALWEQALRGSWAFDDELVSAVGEAVECGVGEDGVGEETDPLGDVPVAGDDEAGAAVALDDERVEVLGLLWRQAMQPEVIEDEKVWSQVAAEDSFEAVVGTSLAEFAEQEVGAAEEDGVSGPGGRGTEGLGKEGLAHADGSDEEDVLLALEELEGEELVEVAPVDLDGCAPVEALQGDALLEAGTEETPFQCQVVSALDLIGEDEGEEGRVIELLGPGQGGAVRKRRDRLTELAPAEQRDEVGFEVHPVASSR